MLDVLTWWLAVQVFGLAALPIAVVVLRWLPDRGYAFAKPLGLLLAGYLFWLAGFAGVVPTNRGGWLIALAVVAVVSGLVLRGRWGELRDWLNTNRRQVATAEIVFAAGFVLWAIVRAYNPDIAGTEKPMDFAFVNGILRSGRFPPLDPWLAGYSISYYYFGHLLVAGLIDVSGVRPAVGFNLALATLFGLTAAGATSLGSNLVRSLGGSTRAALTTGLVAALLILGVSNLQGAAEFVRLRGVGSAALWQFVGVNGALEPRVSPTWYPDEQGWWWWRATRVINTLSFERDASGRISSVNDRADYTITEFPFFSFMLGDLHPHVMALPFGLLALAFALNVLFGRDPPTRWNLRRQAPGLFLTVLVLGALGFLNSWDFPTYGAIYLLSLVASVALAGASGPGAPGELTTEERRWRLSGLSTAIGRWWSDSSQPALRLATAPRCSTDQFAAVVTSPADHGRSRGAPVGAGGNWPTGRTDVPLNGLWQALWPLGLIVVLGGVLLYAPFYATFRTQASGILPVTGPGTRWIHFALIWGLFVVPALAVLIAAYRSGALRRRKSWLAMPIIPLLLWSAIAIGLGRPAGYVVDRWLGVSVVLLLAGVGLGLLADRVLRPGEDRATTFAVLLVTVALGLILGCELFFIRDVFGNRMNTIFKLYYQAWVLLAIAGSTGLYCAVAALVRPRRAARAAAALGLGIFVILFVGSLYYPVAATYTKAGMFRGQPTLDGLAFVERSVAGEYDAVRWLDRNVHEPAVVVEAVGGQYSDFGRISSRTGLPTIIGWAGHEVQWRGSDALFRGRDSAVDQIYRSTDRNAVSAILHKYDVQYVVVGAQERAKYGPSVGQQFEGFMDVAYRNPDVTIYRVRA